MLSQALSEISTRLQHLLSQHRESGSTVVGYMVPYSTPLNIQNILLEKISRNLETGIKFALQELRDTTGVDSEHLDNVLLEKYGILPHLSENSCNAYLALPSAEDPDHSLHQYFLQPFLLFPLEDRKFVGIDPSIRHRQWLWNPEHSRVPADSAPLLRTIIQILILEDIFKTNTETSSTAQKATLENYYTQLMASLDRQAETLFHALTSAGPSPIQGNPESIPFDNLITPMLRHYPGLMDIAAFYPLGRLFLVGQSTIEVHHDVALKNVFPFKDNPLLFYPLYALYWCIAHLNLSTSFFWMYTIYNSTTAAGALLIHYIRDEEGNLMPLFIGSVFVFLNTLLLVFSPMLILMNWVYGLTAIPFSLLRHFCLSGPFDTLRHYTLLKTLDALEGIKDFICWCVFVLPVLTVSNTLLIAINSYLPGVFLWLGGISSCILLVTLSIALGGTHHLDSQTFIATYNSVFGQGLGALLILGTSLYCSVGLLSRFIVPHLPNPVKNAIQLLFFPVAAFYRWIAKPKVACLHTPESINPNPIANLAIPMLKRSPLEIQKEKLVERLAPLLFRARMNHDPYPPRLFAALNAAQNENTLGAAVGEAEDYLRHRTP